MQKWKELKLQRITTMLARFNQNLFNDFEKLIECKKY